MTYHCVRTMFFFNKVFKVFEKHYGTIVFVFVFVSFILPLSLRCTYLFPFFQPSHSCITRNIRDLILALHWIMFQPNIVSLCDDEQQSRWLPLCRDWKMIGCYAQTELGHGSNIRALETTAMFVPESKGGHKGGSFVINS